MGRRTDSTRYRDIHIDMTKAANIKETNTIVASYLGKVQVVVLLIII